MRDESLFMFGERPEIACAKRECDGSELSFAVDCCDDHDANVTKRPALFKRSLRKLGAFIEQPEN